MAMSEVFSVAAALFASLGGGGAIVLGLSNWLGKVWVNRLIEAEKAKHMREVETFKASLEQAAEDRTRKLEALMRHFERQIEEFYGPLFNMVNQILYVAHDVQRDLIDGVPPDKAETIREYCRKHYFDPIHDRIREILKTRLYLVEREVLPETFEENLKQY